MTTRRAFFKILGFGAGAVLLLRSSVAWAKKVAFGLDHAEALQQVGGSAVMKVKDQEILFVRDSETTLKAFSPHCTHAACPLAYNPETKHIDCSCHGSSFDMSGTVLGGPATEALPTYPAEIKDGKIIVKLPD